MIPKEVFVSSDSKQHQIFGKLKETFTELLSSWTKYWYFPSQTMAIKNENNNSVLTFPLAHYVTKPQEKITSNIIWLQT